MIIDHEHYVDGDFMISMFFCYDEGDDDVVYDYDYDEGGDDDDGGDGGD